MEWQWHEIVIVPCVRRIWLHAQICGQTKEVSCMKHGNDILGFILWFTAGLVGCRQGTSESSPSSHSACPSTNVAPSCYSGQQFSEQGSSMQQTHYTQVCTLVFFCPIGFQIFMMPGGFFTPCKGFPEGSSCPVALFDTCNGVFETLVVVDHLLLPHTPPPPSFCTVHSDYVGVLWLWEYWYSKSLELYHVVHVYVGGGWTCLCLMEHTVNQMQRSTKWCNKCYWRFCHFLANQSLHLRASFLWNLGWRKEV